MHDTSHDAAATGTSAGGSLTPAATIPALRHVEPPTITARQDRRLDLWRSVRTLLAGAAAGALIAVIFTRLFNSAALSFRWVHGGGPGTWAAAIGLLLLAAFVAIAVHEGGHALGGRLGGLHLVAIVVGPIQLVRTDGRVRLGVNFHLGRAGGLVLCVPTRWTGDEAFRRSFRRCVAAGPLASLVVGGVATAVAVQLGAAGGVATPHWVSVLYVGGIISLALGVGTFIPIRMAGGFYSDGAQLLRFRAPSPRAGTRTAPLAPFSALALFAQTQRPSVWDAEVVRAVSEAVDDEEYATGVRSFLYYRALDRGAVADARDALQGAIEYAAARTTPAAARARRSLALEAAIFEGAWRRDAAAARAWLGAAAGLESVDPHGVHVAAAAVAAAEGSHAEMERALARARAVAQRALLPAAALLRLATTEQLAAQVT